MAKRLFKIKEPTVYGWATQSYEHTWDNYTQMFKVASSHARVRLAPHSNEIAANAAYIFVVDRYGHARRINSGYKYTLMPAYTYLAKFESEIIAAAKIYAASPAIRDSFKFWEYLNEVI